MMNKSFEACNSLEHIKTFDSDSHIVGRAHLYIKECASIISETWVSVWLQRFCAVSKVCNLKYEQDIVAVNFGRKTEQ